MKKTYHVQLEPSTVYAKDVQVEADSMDEAVKIARKTLCGEDQVKVTYHPTWVQPRPPEADEDPGWELFEYDHQVFGECADCGITLFEGGPKEDRDNDWPWQYEAGDEGHYTYICYPCAMKRKETGNYCAYMQCYYRDDHHYGCGKCPEKGCKRLQERTVQNLKRALLVSRASGTAVNHFLDNGQIRLAYETLRESGHDNNASTFDPIMLKVKKDLDEGWLD